jgi:hypothetical protein
MKKTKEWFPKATKRVRPERSWKKEVVGCGLNLRCPNCTKALPLSGILNNFLTF